MFSGRTFKGHIPEHGPDIGRWCDDFSSRLTNVVMEKSYTTFLVYQTFLKREKHEKRDPEIRYRIYVDEINNFRFELDPFFSDFASKSKGLLTNSGTQSAIAERKGLTLSEHLNVW